MRLGTFASPLAAMAFLALCAAAPLAQAETLTVSGITKVQESGYQVSVPTFEIDDGTLTEEDIRELFFVGPPSVAGKLSSMSAAAIRIPEIELIYKVPEGGDPDLASRVVYRNLEMTGVADGIAAMTKVGATEVEGDEGVVVTLGEMTVADFDIGALLAFYGLGADVGYSDLRPVYRDVTFAGGTVKGDDVDCSIGAGSVARFDARPVGGGINLFEMIAEIQAAQESKQPPAPETVAALIDWYADLLDAFRSSPMELEGFSCAAQDPDGKDIQVASGAFSIGAFAGSVIPPISLDDLSVIAPDGHFQLGNLTLKEMDFTAPIATVKAASTELSEIWFAKNYRRLIPAVAGFSVSGLDMDVPNTDRDGERVQLKMGGFDLALSDYVNGIPASISALLTDFHVPLPEEFDDSPAAELRAAGITAVTLGFDGALHWDEPSQTIVVDRLIMDVAELGRVGVSATLGNATTRLFADSPVTARRAVEDLTLISLKIDIDNRGFMPLLLAAGGREAGQSAEAYAVTLNAIAQGMVMAVLGPQPSSLETAAAISRFIGGEPSMSVTLTSTDPAGLGREELEAFAGNPQLITGKIEVSATSGPPVAN